MKMKKHLLTLVFLSVCLTIFSQSWSPAAGVMCINPTTTNVGIGTTTPAVKLHIDNGGVKIGNLTDATSRTNNLLRFGDGDYVKIGEWESDDYLSFKASRFNFTTGSLFVNNGNIFVDNSGFLSSNGASGQLRLMWVETFKHSYLDFGGNFYLRVGSNTNISPLVLEKTGNVGIGYPTSFTPGITHTQGYKLGVNGSVLCESLKVNTGIITSSFNLGTNAGLNKILVSDATGNSSWTALASIIPAMSFNGTAVGIGMMPPAGGAYNLYVTKGILTEEVTVKLQTNWPDYVFAKDYNLIPLKEVEIFISKNQHLPGLPSAENVKRDGVNLGEMNSLLLKKIEELTLYVIELEKKYENLESRLPTTLNK